MIDLTQRDDVLVITLANPPVNALGGGLRTALAQAIADAQTDAAVKAIVLTGQGKLFSGGADIAEFATGMSEPLLPDLINSIEASAKPVVAALHGTVFGGGLEVALGCHYRIAAPSARLGLPEVKLGLLPGAGGTQRLPRVIPVEAAAQIITSGTPVPAARAAELGLVDRLVDEFDLLSTAVAFAREAGSVRPTRYQQPKGDSAALDAVEADVRRKSPKLEAPLACIEALRAALTLPFEEGLKKEHELFNRLLGGSQSIALRHAFFAERAAAKIVGLPAGTATRAIAKVGVIGAGTMGGGIAMNFLSAGIPVVITDASQEALDRGTGIVRRNYEASASKGRLSSEQVERAMGLLTPALGLESLADCDLIIEAVYENMDVKKDIFARLDRLAKPGAILASNTSFLDIDEMAAVTARPQDVLGLHFFSPANVMKLVEVIRGAKTGLDVLATGMEISRRIGKVPVVSGVCYGFIGNRMLMARQHNADALLLEGALPEQIDKVHTEFGMPMGPFHMYDLAGIDILWHRDPSRIESISDALCAQNRWGQKTKAGYYDYDEKRRPVSSPLVHQIIEDFRASSGQPQRDISDEEITVRTLYSLVNEGARILEEGIAQRASDIDVVWLYGYGWPAYTGGPMHWADSVGLPRIVEGLKRYAAELGTDFTISPLLEQCAREGRPLDRSSH